MSDDAQDQHAGESPLLRKRPAGLGRGLGALLGDTRVDRLQDPGGAGPVRPDDVQHLPVGAIEPLPGQPRRHFNEAAMAELVASIRERGVIQPIIVRRHPTGRGFQLVAGERRWRAAQIAQLHDIPALVRDLDDRATYEIALIENIQRQDLNAIEEAEAFARLIAEFGHSQEALGRIVGKSRSHVANLLRLLDLPGEVQARVVDGSLSMGHARALIGAPDAEALARRIVDEGLSVRAAEALVRKARTPAGKAGGEGSSRVRQTPDSDIAAVEQHLADLLGLKVSISYAGQGQGAVALHFRSLDQLDMLCQRLSGESI